MCPWSQPSLCPLRVLPWQPDPSPIVLPLRASLFYEEQKNKACSNRNILYALRCDIMWCAAVWCAVIRCERMTQCDARRFDALWCAVKGWRDVMRCAMAWCVVMGIGRLSYLHYDALWRFAWRGVMHDDYVMMRCGMVCRCGHIWLRTVATITWRWRAGRERHRRHAPSGCLRHLPLLYKQWIPLMYCFNNVCLKYTNPSSTGNVFY